MNLKMPALKAALEAAGFAEVRTLLASGNVVFTARSAREAMVAPQVEAAIEKHVGKKFAAIVRSIEDLRALLDADPYKPFRLPENSKRVVTFLRAPPKSPLELPIERDGARILKLYGRELLSAYVVSDKGPVFMAIIEKACGKDITTRTWQTTEKVTRAGEEDSV
jgi:uncharacterized protein (DUF1697 family)